MRWWRIGAAISAALLWNADDAHAGNADSFYYSDDAAMAAGAVVAKSRDAGAIWYNPAGLGGNERGELNFNGTALGIRFRSVPSALITRVPGNPGAPSSDLDSSDFFSTPHTLTFVRSISPKLSFGFGLFVTTFDIRNAESQTQFNGTSPIPGSTTAGTYTQRIDYALQQAVYHAGPAIGYEVQKNLRIGVALFGTYGKNAGFSQYLIGFNDLGVPPTTTGSLVAQSRGLFSYVGLRAAAGVQFDATPDLHLGLLVRSPEFLMTSSNAGVGFETVGVAAPGIPGTQRVTIINPGSPYGIFDVVSPMRVIASIAHDFAPRTWISAEADFQTGVSTVDLEQDFTVNGRVGGRYALSEKLGLGAGLFTDRSTRSFIPTALGGDRVDYYGLTAGAELLTPLSLKDKPAPDALVLSTTLAFRYAVGLGSSRAADIDFVGGNPPIRAVGVTYHEIVPYIGSGVRF